MKRNAVLIDSEAQQVSLIELRTDPNKNLDELRNLIGCEWIESLKIDKTHSIWMDEEGKLKKQSSGFRFLDMTFVGNAVVLGGVGQKVKPFEGECSDIANEIEWLKF